MVHSRIDIIWTYVPYDSQRVLSLPYAEKYGLSRYHRYHQG